MKEQTREVIIGIDLGTTNSAVGVVESGFPILLADEEGQRLTPSAVWYSGEDGSAEVGRNALRRRGLGGVITSVNQTKKLPDPIQRLPHPAISGRW